MGQKNVIPADSNNSGLSIVTNGVMTGTSTITSDVFKCNRFDNIGLQVTWTGTPTGTITVNCSNDNITFYALTFDPALDQPAGSAGGYLIDLNQLPFAYANVKYVNSSGSGVLNVVLSAKDVN